MATLTKVGQLTVDLDSIRAFAEKHCLQELSVFGSVLRDDFTAQSDVDVLFELTDKRSLTIDQYLQMQEELKELFGRQIDLVQRSAVSNSFRRHSILTTRQKLYARPAA
jgi:uncharacterized protein